MNVGLSLIFGIKHSKDLNIGLSLIFGIKHSQDLNIGLSLLFGIKHSQDLNIGLSLIFGIKHSQDLNFGMSLILEIQKLCMFSKVECSVEFEARHSLFKRFKSWFELGYIRYLRNLNVEYRTSKKKYELLSFYRFLCFCF